MKNYQVVALCPACLERKYKKKIPKGLVYGVIFGLLVVPGVLALSGYAVTKGFHVFQSAAESDENPVGLVAEKMQEAKKLKARLTAPQVVPTQLSQPSPALKLTRN